MAAKRARGALYVTQDEKKCFGVASDSPRPGKMNP
jgi:hypothetical protein